MDFWRISPNYRLPLLELSLKKPIEACSYRLRRSASEVASVRGTLSRSQYQGLEGKRDRSNYDYSKLKKEEEEETENSATSKPKGALV